jgi:hypothetical protein
MLQIGKRICAIGFALGAFALCSGCGSTRFDTASAPGIHSIGFSGFEEPHFAAQDRLVLNTFSANPNGAPDFNTLMADQNLHRAQDLKAAIARQLQSYGYQTVEDGGASDAILDVKIDGAPPNFAPMYESAAAGYKPEYSVSATLKTAGAGKRLFHQFYVYRDNSISPVDGTILIRSDAKFEIHSAQELFHDPKLAADGVRAAVPIIAQSIGTLLKKP